MTTPSHNHEPKENEGVDESRPAFFASTVAKLARLEILTAVVAILCVGALGYAGEAQILSILLAIGAIASIIGIHVGSLLALGQPARNPLAWIAFSYIGRIHSVRLSTDRFCSAGAFSRYLRFDCDRRLSIVRVGGAGANAPV